MSIKDISLFLNKSCNSIIYWMNKYQIPRRTNIQSHHTEHYTQEHSHKGFRFQEGNQYSSKFKKIQYQKTKEIMSDPFCHICGKQECSLIIHHMDMDKTNNEFDNLIILCQSCHRKEHYAYERYTY